MERKTIWVCRHCLMGIESREEKQATLKHDIELEFDELTEENSKCDWCEESGFDTLYEFI